jgi:hypothetical protein
MTNSVEDFWDDIRIKSEQAKYLKPTSYELAPLVEWGTNLQATSRDTLRVIPGTSSSSIIDSLERELPSGGLVRDSELVRSEDPIGHLMTLVRQMRVPSRFRVRGNLSFRPPHPSMNPVGWDILWCLVAHRELILTSYLKDLVGKKSSRLTEFYTALVEIRFEAQERQSIPSIEEDVESLGGWVEGNLSNSSNTHFKLKTGVKGDVQKNERMDLLLFILNLAKDNQLLEEFIVFSDGMERLTPSGSLELNEILLALDRWVPIGCPLNLLLGWRGSDEDRASLKEMHSRLLTRFKRGAAWAYSSRKGVT